MPNLISPSAWTTIGTGASVNATTGVITLAASGTTIQARQAITTVANTSYTVTWDVTSTPCAYTVMGTTSSLLDIKGATTCDGLGDYSFTFTAPTSQTWIRVQRNTAGTATLEKFVMDLTGDNAFTTEFTTDFD